jgi:hypothetical protein
MSTVTNYKFNSASPGTNTDAVATITGNALKRQNVLYASAGYNATPAAPTELTIKFGSTVKFILPVTAAGPIPLGTIQGLLSATGDNVTITLPAGGSGVKGYVNIGTEQC